MKFEQGKTYQFTNKQFNIARDNNNRLIFTIPDPASAGEYRVLAFDYQNNNIPDRITCIYNGNRFEQDPLASAALLYKPGDIVPFCATSDIKQGRCTMRDEQNDVTYKNLKVGKAKFKRFDRINCRIDSVSPTELVITPLLERERSDKQFTAEDLKQLPEGRYLRFGVLEKLLSDEAFAGVSQQLAAKDNAWVVTMLEESLDMVVSLVRRRALHKDYILPGLERIAVALIERTDYVSKMPKDLQQATQDRLESVAARATDYRRVYNLLLRHEADSSMHAILGSMKRSSRFYQPEEKVRLLDAMLTLEAVDVNRYMESVLDILTEHHANPVFMQYFKTGVQRILARYIRTRCQSLESRDRNGLRLLVRALGAEQLLAAGTANREIRRRRGLLYACAALLIDACDNDLPVKAIQCYADLVDAVPEFTWINLRDPQRLCYAYLTRPFSKSDLKTSRAVADFEGRTLVVSPDYLTVTSGPVPERLKTTLSYPMAPGMTVEFLTEDRLSGFNAETCLRNPLDQRSGFIDLQRLLNSGSRSASAPRSQALTLEVGDHATICVTGRHDSMFYECRIIDPAIPGIGMIGERDIVAYDINSRLEDFRPDGDMLTFEATVKRVLPDGNYQFTIRPAMNAYGMKQATYDFDSETTVRCVVTGVYKPKLGYYAVAENGYPMVVWLTPDAGFELHRSDIVEADVVSVNSENGNLFVKGEFRDLIDPADIDPADILTVDGIYHRALRNAATGMISDDFLDDVERANMSHETAHHDLEPQDLLWILRMMCRMAFIGRQALGRRYSMIAICRIIASMASMETQARLYSLLETALAELGSFASTSRVDLPRLQSLADDTDRFPVRNEYLTQLLQLLRILAALDRPDEFRKADYPESQNLEKTSRMVSAYNKLQGLGLDAARREILKGIYDTLGFPQPQTIDVECLKVREDERNEFKTSLIYPADNNMHADEMKQGHEIMKVVCGMLNHNGGVIYLGVNNQGVPVGLDNDFRFLNNNSDKYDLRDIEDKFSLHFHYYLRNQIGMTADGRTITDYVKLTFEELAGKVTARVSIEPFPGMVRMRDGKVYQRQDSSSIALRPNEQAAFAARRAQENQ